MNLLDGLNEQQRAAVEFCDGPQLVIAGAGSGKTRVLTHKIAYLIEKGLEPWTILALTFTNKAANEMRTRISSLIGEDKSRRVVMGTFHSVFSRILRFEADYIPPYSSSFTIYDQSDSQSLISSLIKEIKADNKQYKPSLVANHISRAKNRLITAGEYPDSMWGKFDIQTRKPLIADIYKRYEERLRQSNAMDFDDLLLNTYILFRDNENVRLRYSDLFDYILVDEYQDTNYAQQAILSLISKEKRRVCVVGDDAQSIYSFRGAEIDNILGFQKSYGGASLFKLESNYRSTQTIVAAANSLIKHNSKQISKEVVSQKEEGDRLLLRLTYSDMDEAMSVCRDISAIKMREGCEYSDFAILYRTNAQSRTFEELMRKQNIPYRIFGGLSFYQRKEIKDIIAYMRIVVNPNDEEALKRVINYPRRGIGDTTIDKISEAAFSRNTGFWDALTHISEYKIPISKSAFLKISGFINMVESWMSLVIHENVADLGQRILRESGMLDDIMSGREPEDISRQENIGEFISSLALFVSQRIQDGEEGKKVGLIDFLQEVSLLTDLDTEADKDEPKVTLTTIHSAKGLEFGTVFIVGLENEIFPSESSQGDSRMLEEERRLMYVAITRAMNHCILTCSRYRMRYGRREFETPSIFINDIDKRLIKIVKSGFDRESSHPRPFLFGGKSDSSSSSSEILMPGFRSRPNTSYKKPSLPDTSSKGLTAKQIEDSAKNYGGLSVGSVVSHSRFGRGKVVALEGFGDNAKATVLFDSSGTKQLLLKFARLSLEDS